MSFSFTIPDLHSQYNSRRIWCGWFLGLPVLENPSCPSTSQSYIQVAGNEGKINHLSLFWHRLKADSRKVYRANEIGSRLNFSPFTPWAVFIWLSSCTTFTATVAAWRCRLHFWLVMWRSWDWASSKAPVVSLSKKLYPYCLVLVGSRNGFERDFTIELK